ncbi:MAG TPA: DUF2807 domain-containing protein [Kofleriaceae bacterium]|nr:DUF2807 domain-containing protein [Kofleriaceae bacterium]
MRPWWLLFLAACGTAGAAPQPDAHDVRAVPAFHAIHVTAGIELDASVDSASRVELAGDPDSIAQITTSVIDGVLQIGVRPHAHLHRVRVMITAPLDAIAVDGAVDGRIAKITGNAFAVAIGGTASLALAGTTRALQVTVAGTGEIDARQLAASTANVTIDGTGDATVQASSSLAATIDGVGEIVAYGHPGTVTKSIHGVGGVELR